MCEACAASKVTMRMPTLLPFGEGRVSGEAIDTRTRSIRRGSGHGTLERGSGNRGRPIPHDELLNSVARRIVDRHVLRLTKLWLRLRIYPYRRREYRAGVPRHRARSTLH